MRVRELVSRCVNIIRNARYIPSVARMAYEVVEAQAEVAKHDYPAAEKRLKRLYSMGLPESVMQRSTASLLMALVSLKLGDPEAAAELVPKAVTDVSSIRAYANPVERAYLQYAGRLILEEATAAMGRPMTLDVGVEYDDLDAGQVRSSFVDTFPVFRSRYADAPPIH